MTCCSYSGIRVGELLDWIVCILPDVIMMIKAEKMRMEYGGEIDNACSIEV